MRFTAIAVLPAPRISPMCEAWSVAGCLLARINDSDSNSGIRVDYVRLEVEWIMLD